MSSAVQRANCPRRFGLAASEDANPLGDLSAAAGAPEASPAKWLRLPTEATRRVCKLAACFWRFGA